MLLPDPTEHQLKVFAAVLSEAGVEPRSYDTPALTQLYRAAWMVHFHLCKLDSGNQDCARPMRLDEFANAVATADPGLFVFGRDDR